MSEGKGDRFVDTATNIVVGALALGMGAVILAAFGGLAVLVYRAIAG